MSEGFYYWDEQPMEYYEAIAERQKTQALIECLKHDMLALCAEFCAELTIPYRVTIERRRKERRVQIVDGKPDRRRYKIIKTYPFYTFEKHDRRKKV